MFKLIHTHQEQAKRVLLMLAFAFAPLLILWQLLIADADRHIATEVSSSSRFVLRQSDAILDKAVTMSNSLASLVGTSCSYAQQRLQPEGTLQPYYRTLWLVKDNRVYCSSAVAVIDQPLKEILPWVTDLPVGRNFYMVKGTPLVPDRPAIVVSLGLSKGRGVLVVVDGQYLLDAMSAAGQGGSYLTALKIEGSPAHIVSDSSLTESASYSELYDVSQSSSYPVAIETRVQRGLANRYQKELLPHYAPYMLLLSLLAAYLAHRFYRQRTSMAAEIRRGMALGQFHMVYQPVIDLETSRCAGAEALMCWNHPVYKTVTQDVFMRVAENNQLAVKLIQHMLTLVRRDLLEVKLPVGFTLHLNVMAEHICDNVIITDMESFMAGLETKKLHFCLEMTERKPLLESKLLLMNMRVLQSMGMKIAIDDFGTGHSTLDYLEKYRVDVLKINKRFLSMIADETTEMPVLNAIISLGRQLNLKLVTEGVENECQAGYLRSRGVKFGQGSLFAEPMSLLALSAWLPSASGSGQSKASPGSGGRDTSAA
ncbi:EAL domain-containing protein [Herbaspirillum sp. RTI4]|uniref:EAL domain-containing protein n=1 Tax=Herbaspirillum sp. RTI4 TaxID=3048640 RepID=UPI002AB55AA6|nr:EAL domain-containing protein [Herbaspirillum sp. RTI4]MDY7577113.1 EAL domain-containing protein [Herbaspirillum sp. RTI4]MEA9982855.1 EAL domain-containing protein [Herbaspirillum sp. RTI4]